MTGWIVVGVIVAAIAVFEFVVKREEKEYKKQEQEKARIAAEKAAEEARIREEQRQKEIAEREERHRQEEADARRRHEEYVRACLARIDAIPSVAVEVKEEFAPMGYLTAARELKYSTLTKSTSSLGIGDYVAVDVETTGLSPTENEIIEVAAVRFVNFQPVEKFETLCKPKKGINAAAQRVNGITEEMVADAPYFRQIAESLHAFIGDNNIVGHNLPFDVGFLEKFGTDLASQKRKYFDTLDLSRKTWRGEESYKLGYVCGYCGVKFVESHRAAGDALAAGEVFKKLVKARTEIDVE